MVGDFCIGRTNKDNGTRRSVHLVQELYLTLSKLNTFFFQYFSRKENELQTNPAQQLLFHSLSHLGKHVSEHFIGHTWWDLTTISAVGTCFIQCHGIDGCCGRFFNVVVKDVVQVHVHDVGITT